VAYYEYFPQEYIALKKEVQNHPDLLIALYTATGFEESIGTIAAYCDVILDGSYSPEDVVKLCDILVMKLKQKGSLILVG